MVKKATNKGAKIRCACAREELLVPASTAPSKMRIHQPGYSKPADVVESEGNHLDMKVSPAAGPKGEEPVQKLIKADSAEQ